MQDFGTRIKNVPFLLSPPKTKDILLDVLCFCFEHRTRTHLNAARMSAAGEGWTEPLPDFIESCCLHQKKALV